MLLNVNSIPTLIGQAARDPALIMVSGIITFVAGLAIVRVHNFWKGGWFVVVTVLGWLFLVGGLARILFPSQLAAMAAGAFGAGVPQHTGFIIGEAIVFLVIGAFLSFKGFSRS